MGGARDELHVIHWAFFGRTNSTVITRIALEIVFILGTIKTNWVSKG